ncbi:helix-turn-helix transcriptional regulator [Fulvimarina endophytica]|uniref:Helix-turn-helix transcriptional regulator n=1 Tax=Fulvimarina endophytica TaxID=2293836 RepID=A0A371X4D6_9HYPH|nr:helix-turn-helix transcriptional regulator [Fulvimarina endophytica]RFC64098.1 helix-turn-helix transcriptional regulator [Fulvimarina endophytica]
MRRDEGPVNDPQTIDRIYEAALLPEAWPRILKEIATDLCAAGGALFSVTPTSMRWTGCETMSDLMAEFVALGRPDLNTRTPRALDLSRRFYGCITDHDLFTDDELDAEPFYRDFLRPRGFGWCIGTIAHLPDGGNLIYTFDRGEAAGPFGERERARLEALRPHLSRAALISARLALSEAQTAASLLGRIGIAAAVICDRRRLFSANAQFEALMPAVFLDRSRRLCLSDGGADRLLEIALLDGATDGVRSIAVRGDEGRPAMVVHLVPVRRMARDLVPLSSHLLVVSAANAGPGPMPSADLLHLLFDLTPAEARVAQGIAEGRTIGTMAAGGTASENTLRSQLKSVFAKTGVSRQAELVRLLSSVGI